MQCASLSAAQAWRLRSMRRRTFIRALACGVIVAPAGRLCAQAKAMPTVGFLHAASPQPSRLSAFKRGLSEAGFNDGTNVRLEYRWAQGRFERLPELAQELVGLRVDVIATPGNATAALAAKAATSTIPIVFGVPEDPVGLGLVASLGRPGGNATGINYFATEIIAKRLGLLRELLPRAVRIAVLTNPGNVINTRGTLQELESAAQALGLQLIHFDASTPAEIDSAFSAMARRQPDGLFVAPDSWYSTRRPQLVALAAKHAIPAIYSVRDYVDDGGLISYGPSITDMFYRVGVLSGRILAGRKPVELPVEQVGKFELVINNGTARVLGLTVPTSILLRADDVLG